MSEQVYYVLGCHTCAEVFLPWIATEPGEMLNPEEWGRCDGCGVRGCCGAKQNWAYEPIKSFLAAHAGHEIEEFEVVADGQIPEHYQKNKKNWGRQYH